ncbi:MAG TPA: hypothetical protein VK009_19495 [Chloroflexota bacterium]|nr:hypothetical protein [Chloroflexota bacterium]
MDLHAFLRWLDIIPGRGWLALGPPALAETIWRDTRANAVTERRPECPLEFPEGTFDVVVAELSSADVELAREMRRVIWPSGTAGAYSQSLSAAELERLFRQAGLRAVQSASLPGGVAVRGAR